MKINFSLIILAIWVFLIACSTGKGTMSSLSEFFETDSLFTDHFTGFSLYNPENKKSLYSYQAHRYFTPASNTKILTLFTALSAFPDSIPAIKYWIHKDTLFIWGMSDPTTLHPVFSHQDRVFTFLNQSNLPIIFCKDHFLEERFGPGWAWDDYSYSYQVEKSFFPVFGNTFWIDYQERTRSLTILPNFFEVKRQVSPKASYSRSEYDNKFKINLPPNPASDIRFKVPIVFSDSIYAQVFKHIIPQSIQIANHCPVASEKKIYYSIPADTVYTYMMQTSDNFIAEHLLMGASGIFLDTIDTEQAISLVKTSLPGSISSELIWHDGSGLSRYNLFTPNAIVMVLDKIRHLISDDKIKKIFPAGGESGTIKNWYKNPDGEPYVFAKTGTLRGVHCLSGYIYTDKGNTLIFSFMHNNFAGNSTTIKDKMNLVLRHIKENL